MPNAILTAAIDALASRRGPPADEAAAVLAEIMAGNAARSQIAAFLIALRTKGETVEEIAGLARDDAELATPVTSRPATTCSTSSAPAVGGGRSTSRPRPR